MKINDLEKKYKSKVIDLKKEYSYKKYLIEFNHVFSEIYTNKKRNHYFGANYFLNFKGKVVDSFFGVKCVVIGGIRNFLKINRWRNWKNMFINKVFQ
jgi:hypothetical protein